MGFFDRDVKNGFDRMFDWNDDGKLDSFEQANQFEFEQRMLEEDSVDDDEDDDDIAVELPEGDISEGPQEIDPRWNELKKILDNN